MIFLGRGRGGSVSDSHFQGTPRHALVTVSRSNSVCVPLHLVGSGQKRPRGGGDLSRETPEPKCRSGCQGGEPLAESCDLAAAQTETSCHGPWMRWKLAAKANR